MRHASTFFWDIFEEIGLSSPFLLWRCSKCAILLYQLPYLLLQPSWASQGQYVWGETMWSGTCLLLSTNILRSEPIHHYILETPVGSASWKARSGIQHHYRLATSTNEIQCFKIYHHEYQGFPIHSGQSLSGEHSGPGLRWNTLIHHNNHRSHAIDLFHSEVWRNVLCNNNEHYCRSE